MSTSETVRPAVRKPLRLWPGAVLAVLLLVVRFVLPLVWADGVVVALLGGLILAVAIVLWWLFFSRAPWAERLGGVALMIAAFVVTRFLVHPSISNGAMGMLLAVLAIPPLAAAFALSALATRRFGDGARRTIMAATILIACGAWTLVRTGGFDGSGKSDFHWRWTPTPEQKLLAQGQDEPAPSAAPEASSAAPSSAPLPPTRSTPEVSAPVKAPPPAAATTGRGRTTGPPSPASTSESVSTTTAPPIRTRPAEWPGFRGATRDDVVRGVQIQTDWGTARPTELWRKPIGPGWSSFAVDGNLIYTQEQRGDDEIVSCYNLTTGAPVWRHRDRARFWESNAGPGPRATPTLANGRVYTLGATGIINALDGRTGAVIWSRNAAADSGAKLPEWGFAGSPLVVEDQVVVATGGRLVAYDLAAGKPRWTQKSGGSGYSSPQLATIDGVPQILLVNTAGVISVSPSDGSLLWKHEWSGDGIVQPVVLDGDVLIGSGSGMDQVGLRRIGLQKGAAGWTATERWTSSGLKPYFNGFIVHKAHAYGFDGGILSCIDLQDGQRKWKGGRYGHGQLVLLPEQDLLLVVTEEGELALVSATPDRFNEIARVPAIEGKTWNHPVLVRDVLLVRNAEEMAAFRLK
jgi:outer membrane protein assembly factor BamB